MSDLSNGRAIITGHQDVFGVPTVNKLVNVLDIGSHYPYSPERWRIEVDGSRVFPSYNAVSQYNHAGPHHELIPAQGETVVIKTAERPRYAVGFEQIFSFAFALSRSLETGDQVRAGPVDSNDGWFLEHNSSHADDEMDLIIREGGTDTAATTNALLNQPVTNLERYELRSAWYRVTRQLWRQSVEVNDAQENEIIGRTSKTDGGPEVGNLPVRFEVTRGASSSALTMDVGSVAVLTQGDKTSIRRNKTHEVVVGTTADAATNTWVPVYGMRIDPDRDIVDTQVSDILITKYGGAGDVRVALQAHDSTKVQDSGGNALVDGDFATPDEHSSQNSVLQETSAVDQAASADGTVGTTASSLGGYQIGYASLHSSGTGSKQENARTDLLRKRALYDNDIAVLWVRADDTSVNVTMNITTEQDW